MQMWEFFICSLAIKHTTPSSGRWQSGRPHLVIVRYCVGQHGAEGAEGAGRAGGGCQGGRGWCGGGGLLGMLQLLLVYLPLFGSSVLEPDLHLKQHETQHVRANFYTHLEAIDHVQHPELFASRCILTTSSLAWQLPPFPETLCYTDCDKPWIL